MHIHKLDYTNTFNNLERSELDKDIFKKWSHKYKINKIKKYKNINPKVIPRNHIIEKIIKETYEQNYSNLFEFNKILKTPYEINKISEKYTKPARENEKVFETFCGT